MILPLAQQRVENNQENRRESAFDAARAGKFMCLTPAKLNSLTVHQQGFEEGCANLYSLVIKSVPSDIRHGTTWYISLL